MPAVDRAREMMIAVPFMHTDTKRVWLGRLARLFRLSERQAQRIDYREVKRIDADTLGRMQAQLRQLQESAAKRLEQQDELTIRTADLRSHQGSGEAAGDRGGAAPAGRRSDRAVAGGGSKSRGHAASRAADWW